ncbi:sensor histidine kinase [Streptomyces phaeochromogenes]
MIETEPFELGNRPLVTFADVLRAARAAELSVTSPVSIDRRRDALIESILCFVQSRGDVVWFAGACEADHLRLRHVVGNATDGLNNLQVVHGTGITGRVFSTDATAVALDYFEDRSITHEYDVTVAAEQINRMIAAPVRAGHGLHGVITLAMRGDGTVGDRAIDRVTAAAVELGSVLDVMLSNEQLVVASVNQERRRVAAELHDGVGALLFALGAKLQGLGARLADNPELFREIQGIQQDAAAAGLALREAVEKFDSPPGAAALTTTLAEDCTSFEGRSGIGTQLMVLSHVEALDSVRQHVVVGAIREALRNVEKHSAATLVVVTVTDNPRGLSVTVNDNGAVKDRSSKGRATREGRGLCIHRSRVEQLGGTLRAGTTDDDEDSTYSFRVWIPR